MNVKTNGVVMHGTNSNHCPLHCAYRDAHVPLWVTPFEAHGMVRHMGYHETVADELAGWIARRLSLCFAAGYLGLTAPAVVPADVVRQLKKMGYVEPRAVELAAFIIDNAPGLYRKGGERRHLVTH